MRFTYVARLMLTSAMAMATSYAEANAPKEVPCNATRGRTDYKVQTRCMRVPISDTVRTYRLYAPKTNSKQSMPVVLVLHDDGGSGSTMEAMTKGRFNRIADQQRLLIAYPDGVDRTWRHERIAQPSGDTHFLRTVLDDLERRYPVNRQRIFIAGMGSGGMFALRVGCDQPEFATAIATVGASLPAKDAIACRPDRVRPLLMINGTDDPGTPWLGGTIKLADNITSEVLSAPESFEHWSMLGDCALPITGMPRDTAPNDGTKFIRHLARECRDGAEVRLYEVVGGGHTWPGGDALGQRAVGKVSREINAADSIWEFFARYGRARRDK